ncbi:hypothetical protein CDAR_124591 [Caerostris darwini]|uniref:DUF4160 domain-containing protein n=1 Tax=Caerostris darwini TaxID=1538125 RepID=A0AAV4RKX6_9ARAC|nr:hypothetical protein CDAR_124591 [Caerostris darwini]
MHQSVQKKHPHFHVGIRPRQFSMFSGQVKTLANGRQLTLWVRSMRLYEKAPPPSLEEAAKDLKAPLANRGDDAMLSSGG